MDSRRLPHAASALALVAILAVTLVPGAHAPDPAQLVRAGTGLGLADLLRNLILFAPLGVGLAWCGIRPRYALLTGAVLSASIELAQAVIPGRNANPLDCVANVAGIGLAIALFRTAPAWLAPAPRFAGHLEFMAGAAVAVALAITGVLFAPAPSTAHYYGHHTPLLAHLAPYDGTVLDASVDGIEIPHGAIADSGAVHARLRGDYALHVDALAGTPPSDLAAIVLITDAAQNEILLLGPEREDLVFRFRSRGDGLGLEPARVRVPHALARISAGDRVALDVRRSGRDLCLAIDGVADCDHALTLGDGWTLLAPDRWVPDRWLPLVPPLWLAALFVPLGYWTRTDGVSAIAWAVAAAALLGVPAVTALRATPWTQLLGAGCGAALGIASRRCVASLAPVPTGAAG